jgi:murein DD-endopeptidase MepM/ murein hydrolase activator NlpD
MKNVFCIVLIFMLITANFAQNRILNHGGGEYKFPSNTTDCISDENRQDIFNLIKSNRELLKKNRVLKSENAQTPLDHPMFIWPVIKNPTAPYNNVWSISNYVDHNMNYPNSIQDWACGTRTYDTSDGYNHQGIDIYSWPFSWYQFQNNQSWVVAAADGIIIGKSDGNFDMNCNFNNGTWNAVYVQHSDGSVAWYGHLKSGSLTNKLVGDTVVAGEYLGVIGSSGNSTGPHLHFEVYNSSFQLVDTYLGSCNNWTSSNDSWWLNQKPYYDPKINAVLTHSQVYSFNSCPQTESVYFMDNFNVGAPVVVSIYLADQLPNTSGLIQMVRPDGSVADSFNFNFSNFYYSSYWYWTYNSSFFNQTGNWKVRFTYFGNTVEHLFNYGGLNTNDFMVENIDLYPNPTNDYLTISNSDNVAIYSIVISDISGKILFSEKNNFDKIDLSSYSNGIYFVNFTTESGEFTKKIIKD